MIEEFKLLATVPLDAFAPEDRWRLIIGIGQIIPEDMQPRVRAICSEWPPPSKDADGRPEERR